MKTLVSAFLLLMVVTAPGAAVAGKLTKKEKDKYGTTYWGKFKHAPYPSKGKKYKDSTIAAFVPRHFCSTLMKIRKKRKGARSRKTYKCYSEKEYGRLKKKKHTRVRKVTRIDYVVHYHGHSNTVAKTFRNHRLREQFSLSLQNSILVVPQGPINAIDSDFGKVARRRGFRKMLMEVHGFLQDQGVIGKRQKIGRVIITSHSGGYRATAMALKHGGLEVSEVYLFDSLYAHVDIFFAWLTNAEKTTRRFINVYYRKKPKARSKELLALLEGAGVRVKKLTEKQMNRKNFKRKSLGRERIIFIRTNQGHSKCTRGNYNYRDYLFSSGLKRVKSTDWFQQKGLEKMDL